MPFLSWSSHQRQVPALARLSQSQGLLLLCRELLGTAQLCLGELSKVAPGAVAAPGAGHTLCSPKPEALAEEEESRLGRKGQSSRFCSCPGAACSTRLQGRAQGQGEGEQGPAIPPAGHSWTHWAAQAGVSLASASVWSSLSSQSPAELNKTHQLCCQCLLQEPAAEQLLPSTCRAREPRVPAALEGRVWGMPPLAGLAAGIVVPTGALVTHPSLWGAQEQLPGLCQAEAAAPCPIPRALHGQELSVLEQEGSELCVLGKGESRGWQG